MGYLLCIICLVLDEFRSCDFLVKTKELSQKPSSNNLHQFYMDSDVVITSNNLNTCVPSCIRIYSSVSQDFFLVASHEKGGESS